MIGRAGGMMPTIEGTGRFLGTAYGRGRNMISRMGGATIEGTMGKAGQALGTAYGHGRNMIGRAGGMMPTIEGTGRFLGTAYGRGRNMISRAGGMMPTMEGAGRLLGRAYGTASFAYNNPAKFGEMLGYKGAQAASKMPSMAPNTFAGGGARIGGALIAGYAGNKLAESAFESGFP